MTNEHNKSEAVTGHFRTIGKHDDIRFVWGGDVGRSEEHTSELQSLRHLVCRLLLEKKNKKKKNNKKKL